MFSGPPNGWDGLRNRFQQLPVGVLILASIGVGLFLAINAIGLAQTGLWVLREGGGGDWVNLRSLTIGNPYEVGGFRWSPPAAWIWVVLVAPIGLPLWQLIHV